MAHAYTRYLGDLSGGQVLGKLTQKSLGLRDTEGVSFFSFPGVSSPTRFKQLYRSRMNSVELTEAQRAEVLEEAVSAFEFNIQVRTRVWPPQWSQPEPGPLVALKAQASQRDGLFSVSSREKQK